MPEFGKIDSIFSKNKMLTQQETERALRFMVAAEYEAIQLYEEIVHSMSDDKMIAVIEDIIREEKVHAGEFLELLKLINPEEEDLYKKGLTEVDKTFEGEGEEY